MALHRYTDTPPAVTADRSVALAPLYVLSAQYTALAEAVYEAGGVADDALVAQLDAITDAAEVKVARISRLARNLAVMVDARKEQARQMQAEAHRGEATIAWLKRYVAANLAALGRDKIETPDGGAALRNNSTLSATCSVEPETLPDWLRVTVTAFSAAKAVEAAKAGLVLPEGVSVTRGQHVRWLV